MSTAMTTAIRVLKSSNTVPAWGKTGCPGKLTDPPGIFSTHLSRGWGALQRNASAIMAAIRPSVLNQHTIEISRSVLARISAPFHQRFCTIWKSDRIGHRASTKINRKLTVGSVNGEQQSNARGAP